MRLSFVAAKRFVLWAALISALFVPLLLAAMSPLIAWRGPVYILACFAGIIALALLLIQPLLVRGVLPGLTLAQSRRVHRLVGGGLLLAVLLHISGLWVTSPPDVIDILFLSSPTPFSLWGVIAMWALFLTALLALFRRHVFSAPRQWRMVHSVLALVIVLGTVIHAIQIEGLMESASKAVLCVLVLVTTLLILFWQNFRGRMSRR